MRLSPPQRTAFVAYAGVPGCVRSIDGGDSPLDSFPAPAARHISFPGKDAPAGCPHRYIGHSLEQIYGLELRHWKKLALPSGIELLSPPRKGGVLTDRRRERKRPPRHD